jgi:hypothetical protein
MTKHWVIGHEDAFRMGNDEGFTSYNVFVKKYSIVQPGGNGSQHDFNISD